jgi:photosystem II stability/assembly factor-like uncharacterized protein
MRAGAAVLPNLALLVSLVLAPAAPARAQALFDEELVSTFTFRNVGPFRMGARTSDIAVPAFPQKDHLYTFYLATWTGGLWKTTNNGTTFEPVFDGQSKLTIGDVTLAPSDPGIVWVGTGDAFTSRSSYAGDGVYKSTDAGGTWENMGLRDSHHIARIVIHPTDPDIVYVAAMGHLYSENEERGVFKTTDGGKSWEKVLYVNEKIGVIDLVLNPLDPDVLYAATYDKQRLPWRYINGGPESGIYKTEDAGATWTRLEGGLPMGRIGRIGLDIYPRNPDIVYAVVENANPRPPTEEDLARAEATGGPVRERMVGGEVYRTGDAGRTWTKMNADEDNVSEKGPYYFSQIRVDPNDDQKIFVTGVSLGNSTDGGRTWNDITWPPRRLFTEIFGDVRTLWIDPENSDRMILGSDAGFFISYDGGRTSDHRYNIPLGEVYAVGVDMEDPYNIYAGLQDHENWKGPSNSARGEITLLDWNAVGNNDGMHTLPDPEDSRWLYTTRQYGGHARIDQKTGIRTEIMPRREEGLPPYRFIWATPFHISPHNSSTVYTGGQVLLRSRDRGDTWQEISPDLSTNDTANIFPSSEGGIPGGIPWFAASTIAESPMAAGIVWVGTSDGKVQVTRDDGASWTDRTSALVTAGAREDAYVSRVRPSHHAEGRAFVTKRGYKFDDFRPFIYRTDDFGATWTSLAANLPHEPINVVWEDRKNPDLLFVGNDTGIFVSIDGGGSWVKMNNNMPNVPVHDLLVHPRENDLVAGSYGRGIFLTNIAPLQEITEKVLREEVHLFGVEPTVQRVTWSFGANDFLFAAAHLETRNEPSGMVIRYYLRTPSEAEARVVVTDADGNQVADLGGGTSAGINTVIWNMRSGAGGGRGFGGGGVLDRLVPPGDYTVTLEIGGEQFNENATITKTQGWSIGPFPKVIR